MEQESGQIVETEHSGWMNRYDVAEYLNTYPQSNRFIAAEEYTISRFPNLKANIIYKTIRRVGRDIPHYSPALIHAIQERFRIITIAPAGYVDIYIVSEKLGRKHDTVLRIIEERLNAGKLSGLTTRRGYYGKGEQEVTLYQEEYLLMELADIARLPEVPKEKGWISYPDLRDIPNKVSKRLAQEYNVTYLSTDTLQTFVEIFNVRKKHPSWFGNFSSKAGKNTEFIKKDLVRFYFKELNRLRAPKGAGTMALVCNRLSIHHKKFKKIINEIKIIEPDFGPQWMSDSSNHWQPYYTQEQVALIASYLAKK